MTAEARDIHIHLTAQPGTTVHITIGDGGIEMTGDSAQANVNPVEGAPSLNDPLEEAIQRLESSRTSANIRDAVEGLHNLGYTLKLPDTKPGKRPENYLRIMDPKYTAHGIGYLTPSNFSFSRMSDRQQLVGMPGAIELQSAVNFPHVHSTRPGLNAARLLKS